MKPGKEAGWERNIRLVCFLAGRVGAALCFVGDPVACGSEGVHGCGAGVFCCVEFSLLGNILDIIALFIVVLFRVLIFEFGSGDGKS